ncbi:MAG: hypothetical protein ACYDA4_06725 [Ignavibacteriaceae bacterium]
MSDFSSKEKFYGDFNNFARNKNVKVTLSNDSSFSLTNGAEIANDTLYSPKEEIKSGIKKIALSDIKGINYTNQSHTTALIVLKDGKRYQAEQLRGNRDSVEFSFTKTITLKDVTSINDIKNISYKNHWLGVIPGFFEGMPLGIVIAGSKIIPTYESNGMPWPGVPTKFYDYTSAMIWGIPIGAIIGSTIGWFMGFNYTYQFNQ